MSLKAPPKIPRKSIPKIPKKSKALTPRQARIMAAIVKEYSNSGQPVGSEELNERYGFGVSSATIRNEMMVLEKAGYIEQPHTSAGRVPTDFGYRYFINELMKRFELSMQQQQFLKAQIQQLHSEHQDMGKRISKLLADQTEHAAFALLPENSSVSGLANIIAKSGGDQKSIEEVAEFFENIEGHASQMLAKFQSVPSKALIGKEHSLSQISNYSVLVSKVMLPSGKEGVIGIIGPKSMRYDKNMTLLEYVAKIISGGALLLLFIKF